MGVSILSAFQKKALGLFKTSGFAKTFYLAGGTALAEFYLHHRKSEDLDFFTNEELDFESMKRFASSIKKLVPLDRIEYQRGFGLFAFFFYPKAEVAVYKIDFGQYPFGTIEPTRNVGGIRVESLYDIAVDKAHTISVRPRLRDFVDLFFILQSRKDWTFAELVKRGQEKFEIAVDPFQLGENLLAVQTLPDMPIMLADVDMKKVQTYFLNEAKALKTRIFN